MIRARKGIIFLFFFFLIVSTSIAAGISRKTITITVPADHNGIEPYRLEFVVPEGMHAFDFMVWGSNNQWGISSVNSSGSMTNYTPVYTVSPGQDNSLEPEVTDSESSEHKDSGIEGVTSTLPGENSSLAQLVLESGRYAIWTQNNPGSTITLQYFLEFTSSNP